MRLILEIHWYRKIGSWLLALNKIYDREGVGTGYGVTVSSRETFPRLRVYTVKPMLATFGSIQSRPNYTGGQITETTWYYENWTVLYPLCTCTVQSAQSGSRVGKQMLHITLSMIRDFKYINGSVATRKFLSVVRTCQEGWKLSGQVAFLLMTEDSGAGCTTTQKLYNSLGRPSILWHWSPSSSLGLP